jgi:hypothetical protein
MEKKRQGKDAWESGTPVGADERWGRASLTPTLRERGSRLSGMAFRLS